VQLRLVRSRRSAETLPAYDNASTWMAMSTLTKLAIGAAIWIALVWIVVANLGTLQNTDRELRATQAEEANRTEALLRLCAQRPSRIPECIRVGLERRN
jgi:hypothetical protein